MGNIEKQAKSILDYWEQYLLEIGFDSSKLNMNAHNIIKGLIKEPFNDKELVKELCKDHEFFFITNIKIIDFCSEQIKNDRQTLVAILKENGENLALLSQELKNDKEIVMTAVGSTGSLEYASEILKDDQDVVLLSLVVYPDSLKFASPRFQNNKELVLELVKKDHYMLDQVSAELKNDAQFLSEYWYYSRNKYEKINVSADALILRIMDNMGENVKPFFKDFTIDYMAKKETVIKKFETCLTAAALNKELSDDLNKELNSKGEKKKKPKL